MFALLALAAVLIEAVFGYPGWLTRSVGHPVMWIGRLITWCDTNWNSNFFSDKARRVHGALTLVLVVALATAAAFGLGALASSIFSAIPAGSILTGLLVAIFASTLIAQRSLDEYVSNVAFALEHEGLATAREEVSQIVGRDTTDLDKAQISRAAIESLAENFSDGVVAPVFWLAVAGLPGIIAYKAINTADSMIGHLSDRHAAFGYAAAKLDDIVNLPASRLAAALLAAAAALIPNASASNAVSALRRDANTHRSPNAGWPEAAMAGALGLALAGPRTYDGNTRDDAWMGDGRQDATPIDIKAALKLYRLACTLQALALAAIVFVTGYLA